MKNYRKYLLIVVIISAFNQSIQAYKESFANHTTKVLAIGMKYKGSKDLEFIVIQPNENQTFEPGSPAISGIKNAIDSNKSNAIPNSWYYLIAPPSLDDNNKNSASWTTMNILWFKPETYKFILKIASEINKSDKSAQAVTEIIKTESQKATPEMIQQLKMADYNLEVFVKIAGKNIGRSMAQDLHIDVIEDENGTIYFIASL